MRVRYNVDYEVMFVDSHTHLDDRSRPALSRTTTWNPDPWRIVLRRWRETTIIKISPVLVAKKIISCCQFVQRRCLIIDFDCRLKHGLYLPPRIFPLFEHFEAFGVRKRWFGVVNDASSFTSQIILHKCRRSNDRVELSIDERAFQHRLGVKEEENAFHKLARKGQGDRSRYRGIVVIKRGKRPLDRSPGCLKWNVVALFENIAWIRNSSSVFGVRLSCRNRAAWNNLPF